MAVARGPMDPQTSTSSPLNSNTAIPEKATAFHFFVLHVWRANLPKACKLFIANGPLPERPMALELLPTLTPRHEKSEKSWRGIFQMRPPLRICLTALGFVLSIASTLRADPITYTSDPTIADFTGLISSYATFSHFSSGDVSSPFTPTSGEIATSGFRVYGGTLAGPSSPSFGGQNWILATFAGPVSSILVFPNLDHFGSAFDGYQYSIEGSNDLTTWTPLFDALTVTGAGEPFTLGSFTGTGPLSVNNVLTPGAGPGGTVGYEARFSFGTAYKYYAFGASTEAFNSGNPDSELSGVGATAPVPASVPEPSSLLLLCTFLLGLGRTIKHKFLA